MQAPGEDEEKKPAKQVCTLNTLPEGRVGTVKIYKSGKVELWFGDHKLSVDKGTQVGFLQVWTVMSMCGSTCTYIYPLKELLGPHESMLLKMEPPTWKPHITTQLGHGSFSHSLSLPIKLMLCGLFSTTIGLYFSFSFSLRTWQV